MLHSLRIENLALMDAVSLEFAPGYTAVTGETGAGKSVLLGALSLLSGARADKTLIRQGAETCTLEAAFLLPATEHLDVLLQEMGLPSCDDGQLLIRRILSHSRPSRITVNGAMATLAQLQEIGKKWIDFHGPGEPQKLFHESEQLALLDLFAGLRQELDRYRDGYRAWRAQLEEIERLRNETRLSPEERAFLKTQVQEIDKLKLSEARIQQLEQDFRRLSGSQELKELCAQLDDRFLGTKGICDRLQGVLPVARKLAELDPATAHLADRVESLVIEANDLATEWAGLAGDADFNPSQARQIEADMDTWLTLRRRYGTSVETVLARRDSIAERIALQGNLEETIGEKQAEADRMEAHLRKEADALRSARLKAAQKLGREAEALLRELGFKKPRLNIDIVTREKLGPTGNSDCRMTFSPNPGNALLPLNKIASSGEMARVMLALKSVLAAVDYTPVLVFDEVDANIGGEVATAVAKLLAKLGKDHQVFSITHLPQVAAVAKNHYVVEKHQDEESTTVRIDCLDDKEEARIEEFARMLGNRSSKSAREHAARLLKLGD